MKDIDDKKIIVFQQDTSKITDKTKFSNARMI